MADLTGQMIGGYRLIKLLGRGGVSHVYLAESPHIKRKVAVKILHWRLSNHEHERWLEGLRDSVTLNHPHILKLFENGIQDSKFHLGPFWVMEYVPGGTLRQQHPRGTMLPLSRVTSYVKHIADILQYAHDTRRAYLFLSPNVLFLSGGEAISLDFSKRALLGLMEDWESSEPITTSHQHYVSPEELKGAPHLASDQYSLAIMVYEWLIGSLPFTGSLFDVLVKRITQPPPPLREKNPSIPQTVEQVVLRALAKDPKDRYPSVREFAEAFERACIPTGAAWGSDDRIGLQYSSYRLMRRVDGDGSPTCYLGEHISTKSQALVKIGSAAEEAERQAFLAEARVLAASTHPHLLHPLDFGSANADLFVVTSYPALTTLRDLFLKSASFVLATVAAYIKQLTAALQALHDQGLFLGVIKPEDIVFYPNYAISLDLSNTILHRRLDDRGLSLRDVAYAAYEEASPAADQHALGIVLYEWLAGAWPFAGSTIYEVLQHKKGEKPLIPLREKVPAISPAVEGVVMTALEKDPQYRFPDMRAFAEALDRAVRAVQAVPTPDLTGQQLGSYRLVRPLGHGGFADVYLGEHVKLKTSAAVKVLHGRPAQDELDNFLNEARTIAKLEHQHILRMLEYNEERGHPYLITAYAPNGTLRDRHPKGVRLPPERVVSYLKQVADALQHAHNQKLIHRDIKPENMLLGRNGEVLLSDFGIAVVAHSTKSQRVEQVVGTVTYMAPEQSQGRPRLASDQYSLGIVAYEWLAGMPPFKGSYVEIATQHALTPPASLRDKVPTLAPALDQVVLKALTKDPKDRYESVAAFLTALEEANKT